MTSSSGLFMALSCSSRQVGVKMWVDPGDNTHKRSIKSEPLVTFKTKLKCVLSFCYECLLQMTAAVERKDGSPEL